MKPISRSAWCYVSARGVLEFCTYWVSRALPAFRDHVPQVSATPVGNFIWSATSWVAVVSKYFHFSKIPLTVNVGISKWEKFPGNVAFYYNTTLKFKLSSSDLPIILQMFAKLEHMAIDAWFYTHKFKEWDMWPNTFVLIVYLNTFKKEKKTYKAKNMVVFLARQQHY